MGFDLNGSWVNSYGSKMDLFVDESGGIVGSYSSTTGSTGVYAVIGHCFPNEPETGKGLAVVLSIYWRPINTETPDESWHWMSTYCGQLLASGELSVINSLVASCEFSGFSAGDYIDKLSFTKVSDSPSEALTLDFKTNVFNGSNPICGEWISINSDIKLAFTLVNQAYGLVVGVAEYQGEVFTLQGFTDTYAEDLTLQSVSVCGYIAGQEAPVSLSGWLDLSNNSLQLSRWIANATTPNNVYYQADVENWLLLSRK